MNRMIDNVVVSRSADPIEEEPDDWQIRNWLTKVILELDLSHAQVSVYIVSEGEMRSLNSSYRDSDKATNVLSFSTGIETDGCLFLGDIVICSAIVDKEARCFDMQVNHRYVHILVHGLLHLLGYDHIEAADQEKMETLENSLLTSLGFPNPYELS